MSLRGRRGKGEHAKLVTDFLRMRNRESTKREEGGIRQRERGEKRGNRGLTMGQTEPSPP